MTSFQSLSIEQQPHLWRQLVDYVQSQADVRCCQPATNHLANDHLVNSRLPNSHPSVASSQQLCDAHSSDSHSHDEYQRCQWLMALFNELFAHHQVVLVRGGDEPEYFPATATQPARLVFAHGYFASALHEISHWCIAGKRRRQLNDFGYWYIPDGRNQAQQKQFEQLEIKPQALECLFTLACGGHFRVSLDNLNGDCVADSSFADDVIQQARDYLQQPQTLPKDAQTLLFHLYWSCQKPQTLLT